MQDTLDWVFIDLNPKFDYHGQRKKDHTRTRTDYVSINPHLLPSFAFFQKARTRTFQSPCSVISSPQRVSCGFNLPASVLRKCYAAPQHLHSDLINLLSTTIISTGPFSLLLNLDNLEFINSKAKAISWIHQVTN